MDHKDDPSTEDVVPETEEPDREEDRAEVKLILENAEAFHEHGLALPTRTIYVGAEEAGVDVKMAERFVKNMHTLESLSSAPITVLWNNPGGDMYHGLAMVDAITESRCDVKVVVRGHAMSMGSIVLQVADERIMGPTSTQMLHYGYMSADTHAKTFQKWAEEANRLDEWMEQLYLKRIREKHPRFSLARLRKMLAFDTFLDAQASIELGLADVIG